MTYGKFVFKLVAVAGMCAQDADFSDAVRLKIAVSDRVVVVSEADVVKAVASVALRSFSDSSRASRVNGDVATCSPKGRNRSMLPIEEQWSGAVDLTRPKKGISNQFSFVAQRIDEIMSNQNNYNDAITSADASNIDDDHRLFEEKSFGAGHFHGDMAVHVHRSSNRTEIIDRSYLNRTSSEDIKLGKFLC